ncbi:helix-turn-helix domain-containing protein [Chitinophaga arvensicola]|nr:helix-turn-helix domain-containing protein [Chitinophaga arvensicola]
MVEIFNDIKKLYTFTAPHPALADYIEFFSETSLEAMRYHIGTAAFTVKLFPSYTPTIWINLGTPYQLVNGKSIQIIDEYTDILLLRNEIIERRNLPTDNIFTVKFTPGGFEAIFGFSQTKIGSAVIPLQQIIPATIIRKLKGLGGLEDRQQLLQELFLEKLEQQKRADPFYLQCIKDTMDAFSGSGMAAANHELAKQLFISDKSLYRYFTRIVGTSPKNYLAITRARIALTAYVANADLFSPYQYGYYDRSHFYKDVVKFTGRKLSAFTS